MGPSRHVPVMLAEVMEWLRADQEGLFLDCTAGGGGHTRELLNANKGNRVVALDRDPSAIERLEREAERNDRLEIRSAAFSDIAELYQLRIFNGVLADLGVSTDQLKSDRGFSFQEDAPLDMRMDSEQGFTAHELVNESEPQELFKVLKTGGVGREASSVVSAIVAARPIESTGALARVINVALAGKAPRKKTNPATVVFQALRIAVNDELSELKALLDIAPKIVREQGRLAVICFHSLEDRVVTNTMRKWAGSGVPALWPGLKQEESLGTLLTRRPIAPSQQEIDRNASARSARLRIFEFN